MAMTDADGKLRKEESPRKDGKADGKLGIDPGPAKILLAPPNSEEYTKFLSDFVARNADKREASQKYPDIGLAEVKALVGNFAERKRGDEKIAGKELRVMMIIARVTAQRDMLVETGGALAVCAGMRRFGEDADIAAHACKAMINMSRDGHHKPEVGKAGGIEQVVTQMQEFRGDDDVQMAGIWFIGAFCQGCHENKAIAGACGAILAVIEALKAFPGHEQIVQIGVWSLGVLASLNADNALKIGKSGGITVILDSTKAWMKNPSTVDSAVFTVACLASAGGKVAEVLIKKEAPQVIMTCTKTYPNRGYLRQCSLIAMSHLGDANSASQLITIPVFAFFQ